MTASGLNDGSPLGGEKDEFTLERLLPEQDREANQTVKREFSGEVCQEIS